MKKIILILLLFFLFIPFNVKAYNAKDATIKMNDYIENAINNNNWKITYSNQDNDYFSVQINIGDINSNEDLSEVMNKIPNTLLNKNIYKSTVTLLGCKSKDKCDDNNFDYTMNLRVNKEDTTIYLLSTSLVTKSTYDGFKNAEKVMYIISTNQKGFAGDVTKEGSYVRKIGVEENYDKTIGRIGNPKVIKQNTSLKVPDKNDSFWDDVGNNKCYYFVFDYSTLSNSDYVRYKITDREDALNYIYWGNDPTYTLASHLIEDFNSPGKGIFGVSKNNYYAICDLYGETLTFKYMDDAKIKAYNEQQQQEANQQNGEDSAEVMTEEEREELGNAIAANNGKWDPESLCGENNENCNVDITAFCTNPYSARTLKFIGLIITIAKILVPAIIIILGFIDLTKIIISGKVEEARKQATNIGKRIGIGIIIFVLPTILITIYNVAYSIVNDTEEITDGKLNIPENFKNCVGCILDATNNEACIADNSLYEKFKEDNSGIGEDEGGSSGVGSSQYGNFEGLDEGYEDLTSGNLAQRGNTQIKFDKSIIVLTKNYVNHAKINANVANLKWSSSNKNIVTVNSKGEVTAKKNGSATITATAKDGSTAKIKVKVIKRAVYLGNTKWKLEKGDYTKEEKESYINLADELCHSRWFSSNPSKYTFCPAETLSYYTGTDKGNLTKHYMKKKQGLSATNYVVFLSSAKQTITLLQKNTNGKWKVLKSGQTSTGKTNNVNHYRHDFWLGAMYKEGGLGITFQQFCKYAGRHCNFANGVCDDWYASRAIHLGGELGYPHSAGCGRITASFRDFLYKHLKNQYGTRIIYY